MWNFWNNYNNKIDLRTLHHVDLSAFVYSFCCCVYVFMYCLQDNRKSPRGTQRMRVCVCVCTWKCLWVCVCVCVCRYSQSMAVSLEVIALLMDWRRSKCGRYICVFVCFYLNTYVHTRYKIGILGWILAAMGWLYIICQFLWFSFIKLHS